MGGEGASMSDAQRQLQRRRARPSVLFVALFVFLLLPDGAESLFGFGRKKAAPAGAGAGPEPAASEVEAGEASGEAPPLKGGRGTEKAGGENAGEMGAWEGEDGQLHMIRAERKPSGLWEFPVGTIVPKDPTTMARIISLTNALGEHFQCLLPARKRPPRPMWIDVPQVPVVESIGNEKAEAALRVLEGKCFYRQDTYWTYEFCYRSHVRQFKIDPNSNQIIEEHILGRFNASVPFEVHTTPDRTDHTNELDMVGPAWTTALVTRYGGGEPADQYGNGWYSADWGKVSLFGFLPFKVSTPDNLSTQRPRQVAVKFKCLLLEDDFFRDWFDRANLFLDKDRVPFDVQVLEVALGVYEVMVRSEALCASPLLRTETNVELSPYGNIEEDVMCQSESSGEVYQLKDVPGDDRFYHKFRQALSIAE